MATELTREVVRMALHNFVVPPLLPLAGLLVKSRNAKLRVAGEMIYLTHEQTAIIL